MPRQLARTPWTLTLGFVAALGCDPSGGGAPLGDATATDAATDAATDIATDAATTDVGALPAWDDDAALVAWVASAVAACPPVSLSTAPGLWATSLLTEAGCTIRHPAEWSASLVPGRFECTADATRHVGLSIIATALAGTDWDEVSLGDHLVAALTEGYPDLAVISAATQTDPYGLGVRFRVLVLKLSMDGTPTLAVAKVLHDQCSVVLGSCPLTATLAWAPAAELPAWACTLAQIEATFHCPSGGGSTCDEGDCDASCRSDGASGGTCVGDSCMCH